MAGPAQAQKAGGTLRISRTLVNQGIINPQGGVIDLISNSLTNQGTLTGFGTYKAKEVVNDGRALIVNTMYTTCRGSCPGTSDWNFQPVRTGQSGLFRCSRFAR